VPCRDELPELREFVRSYAGNDDVQMIGIVRDPLVSETEIRTYVEDEGMDWTIAFDPGSRAALDFATRGQPETFLVAPNGEVMVFFFGPVTARSLERALVAVGGPAAS
jgi:hypothetical protein